MRYIVVDERIDGTGDIFNDEFDDLDEAISEAEFQWERQTFREKKTRRIYVLESVNPDVEAENHDDGNIVWEGAVE